MRLIAVAFALVAFLVLSQTTTAGPFDYLCHDRGDGTYDRVQVDLVEDAQAHVGHVGDIIPELFYGETQVGPQNYDPAGEDIWAVGCVVPVEPTIPAPPTETPEPTDTPEFTEAQPTPIVVNDPIGYNDPPTTDTPVVTQLPDTGSGTDKPYAIWGGVLMGIGLAAALVALAFGLARIASRRSRP